MRCRIQDHRATSKATRTPSSELIAAVSEGFRSTQEKPETDSDYASEIMEHLPPTDGLSNERGRRALQEMTSRSSGAHLGTSSRPSHARPVQSAAPVSKKATLVTNHLSQEDRNRRASSKSQQSITRPSSKKAPHRRSQSSTHSHSQYKQASIHIEKPQTPPWLVDAPLVYRDKQTGLLASHGRAEDAVLPGNQDQFSCLIILC